MQDDPRLKKPESKHVDETDFVTQLADEWNIGCDSMLTGERLNAEQLMNSLAEATQKTAPPSGSAPPPSPSPPPPRQTIPPVPVPATFPEIKPEQKPAASQPPPPPSPPSPSLRSTSGPQTIPLPPPASPPSPGATTHRVSQEFEIEVVSEIDRPSKRVMISDVTADFPSSTNPFKNTSGSALKEVALAESTAEATLKWLSENADPEIRQAVAINQKCPEAILKKLSKDPIGSVRLGLLDNPAVPPSLVVDLINDSNPLVSLRAYEVLDLLRKESGLEPLKRPGSAGSSRTVQDMPGMKSSLTAEEAAEVIEFLKMIARRHSTPTGRLSELAGHPSAEIRAEVARNAKASIDTLLSLAHDQDVRVRTELIHNTSCPIEVLEVLQNDRDTDVAKFARSELSRINPD
ncbi:MAG: HEAT repeat domain-containing protein [Candidatus Obscuribacterales bacterium]